MADIIVEYDDHCGDDLKVCRMAKDSFGRTTVWERRLNHWNEKNDVEEWEKEGWEFWDESTSGDVYRRLSDKDQRLIKMLSRGMGEDEYQSIQRDVLLAAQKHDYAEIERLLWRFRNTTPHLAPFGHCFVTFKFQAPVFVMRHIVKHEYIRLSELSMRYVRGMPEYYRPKSWRMMAADVKQGSGGDHFEQGLFFNALDTAEEEDAQLYQDCLAEKLCPEQARTFLRLCHMTQGHFSGSMDAIAGIVQKRMDPHAQEETREFARQIDTVMAGLYPHAWTALMEGIER